jgi:two-component system, chemotaxis family, protein-glutamate methylesterase/glutaminase
MIKKSSTVLIVDDSRFMQEVLGQALRSMPDMRVVGIASSGKDAVAMANSLKPDLATLDIILPDMDGLEVLAQLKACGTRVLILSDLAQPESTVAVQALEAGAVDCLAKPAANHRGSTRFREILMDRMRQMAAIEPDKLNQLTARATTPPPSRLSKTIVVIGSSAGGPLLLREIIPHLPAALRASVLVVQHLPEPFTRQLATQLAAASEIRVRPAANGDALVDGTVLVAPGDEILKIEWLGGGWGCVSFSKVGQSPHGVKPWIDAAMATAALLYGRRSVGVLLSGMGRDGVEGMKQIKKAGGITIAQDEETSLVYGMPKAASDAGAADKILPVHKIADAIAAAVRTVGGMP